MSLAMLATKSEAAGRSKAQAPSMTASSGLRIGDADRAFEREADRVADEIMASRTLDWSLSKMSIGTPPLQPKCVCGGSGKCEAFDERKTVQRKPADPAEAAHTQSVVHEVLNSPGRPLDQETRAFFEPRFGYDFGNIRIHADAHAAESAQAVGALAYTVGPHVVFGRGNYSPKSDSGRRLLAHELAYAQQQRGVSNPSPATLRLDDPSSDAESEAARHADAIVSAESSAARRAGRTSLPIVARACLTEEACKAKTERTPEELMKEVTPSPKTRKSGIAEKRRARNNRETQAALRTVMATVALKRKRSSATTTRSG